MAGGHQIDTVASYTNAFRPCLHEIFGSVSLRGNIQHTPIPSPLSNSNLREDYTVSMNPINTINPPLNPPDPPEPGTITQRMRNAATHPHREDGNQSHRNGTQTSDTILHCVSSKTSAQACEPHTFLLKRSQRRQMSKSIILDSLASETEFSIFHTITSRSPGLDFSVSHVSEM